MPQHPKGTQARVLLSSVFGPYAQDDEFGSRSINPMELYHNQVTREQGPFSLRLFHRSWGIIFIQHNISAPCAVLDFPTRERFIEELKAHEYDIVGVSGIIVNIGKVREMCRLVREHSPTSTIVVGGHVAAIPGLQHMIDADHIVKGEGVSWFRSFLGEDPTVPVNHPVIPSSFGFSIMGLRGPQGGGSPAATIIPSVGCPMGCNFCTTSAFFGGKGKVINFFEHGAEIFHAMCDAEARLGVKSFFVMDENFLLYKERAMELLEHMKEKGKAWSLYVFSSANAISKYKMRELVELGVAWIWMGLEARQSGYSKLKGADTVTLTKELQAHGIGVLGSTIVGLEHHTPDNIQAEIEHAVAHDTDFHQFMLYTPVPGTPLYEEMAGEGRLIDVDLADIHGQDRFNFEHAAMPRDSSKRWLDWAFRRDYEKNGPSVYRLAKTMMEGWKRYHDDPDPRVRQRFQRTARDLRRSYGAALFAMEKYLRDTNVDVSLKIRALRRDMEGEFGALTRWINRAAGPVLLWTSRRDARKYPRGKQIEPMTFIERRNWPEPV
ncbi:MAG: B12-binding domain-containing radical SAM protein [Acidobacteria bacterium]|nr:B12-binding domain-containing radical SAM protein [Acidobacteriota bacterium]